MLIKPRLQRCNVCVCGGGYYLVLKIYINNVCKVLSTESGISITSVNY